MNVYADLVRLPAVLSAPGDALLGAAAGGRAGVVRPTASAALSSALTYMAGMALNDYADRHVDAVERPGRPIPSGRISPGKALAVGTGLLAADLVVAWWGSGRRGVAWSLATSSAVIAYDFAAKDTPAGPATMALCRFLDVQRGSPSVRAAVWPAALVAAHTYAITQVSRHEVKGADPAVGQVSAAVTAMVAAAVTACAPGRNALVTAVATGTYLVPSVRASLTAATDPTPQHVQKIVKTGVLGMIPLQSALIAAHRKPVTSVALLALWQGARTLAARRRVT
ncbi:SCO3242 family prenyltransferase [Kineosporia succinea]|uniref:4-hydroxybenzoate polyprenyltransferase n=1 Tax=Kineosporia succinea TaxID=84632 RepID=A0ABT9NZF7_9ACTN|nr:UbiA family prenyltransferase [Kineosporia succinea]MDP9825816.1 4-hydroxybenzoate polyprenyltransferase [Kineosporia succinea]